GANYCANAFDPVRCRQVAAEWNSEAAQEERERAFWQLALNWFEVERTQLLTAFGWGYDQKKYERVVSFAGNLFSFFQARSYWQDWETTHLQALAAARISENKAGEGHTLNNLGLVYNSQGRWEEAIAHYQQSLEIKRTLGDRHGEGQTLGNLGYLYSARAQYAKAIEYWQAAQTKLHPDSPEAQQIAQKLKNPYPTRQILAEGLIIAIVLIFIGFNLLRGHWLIAALTLLAWASLITYRLWKLRRGNR
ncbi:MAG: tetratricopeptide repeat protein, partial [Phormidesmis sp. RL_2_1]|nr:tetratricopeptide repeat protein [Phormidesmis sp. RL_2_1]